MYPARTTGFALVIFSLWAAVMCASPALFFADSKTSLNCEYVTGGDGLRKIAFSESGNNSQNRMPNICYDAAEFLAFAKKTDFANDQFKRELMQLLDENAGNLASTFPRDEFIDGLLQALREFLSAPSQFVLF
jgi:hypothetical protein